MIQIRFTTVASRIKSCFKQWIAGRLLLPIILFATLLITGFVTADTALPPFGSSPFPAPKITASSVFQENEWWKVEARNMVRLQIKQRGIEDERLLQVMRNTPRHRFVPEPYSGSAYSDSPLPIGHDQTISQPYIVALMTNLLDVDQQHNVLEVGTGSGYQAAILARLAGEVYSIEIVQELAQSAKALLDDMGYDNVHVKWGDGYQGWPAEKPFDRIIVTAAPEKIPQALVEQLKPGGKMVLPVGDQYQVLKVVSKNRSGKVSKKTITGVRFVPMIHPEKPLKPEDK